MAAPEEPVSGVGAGLGCVSSFSRPLKIRLRRGVPSAERVVQTWEGGAGRHRAPVVRFLVKRPSPNLPLWETETGSFLLPRSPKPGPIGTQWTFGGLPFPAARPPSSCRPCCSGCPCVYAGCGRVALPSDFSQPPQGSGELSPRIWPCSVVFS